jgi:hypothetical protein
MTASISRDGYEKKSRLYPRTPRGQVPAGAASIRPVSLPAPQQPAAAPGFCRPRPAAGAAAAEQMEDSPQPRFTPKAGAITLSARYGRGGRHGDS